VVITEAASGVTATAAAADGEGAVEEAAVAREAVAAEDGEATMRRGQDISLEQQ
jgi:hypothetical protein